MDNRETQIEDLIQRWREQPATDDEPWAAQALSQCADELSALLREEAPSSYTERDLMQMFSDGVDVARAYGDNAFHLWGPQLERQFRRAFERLKNGEGQCIQPPELAPKGGEE